MWGAQGKERCLTCGAEITVCFYEKPPAKMILKYVITVFATTQPK